MRLSETSIRISLPYNHDPSYPEWLDGHCEVVNEIFLPIHGNIAPSARHWFGPADPCAYREQLRRLIPVLRRRKIEANVVINLLVPCDKRAGVLDEIGLLRDRVFEECMSVAVADFHLGQAIRGRFPELKLTVSTIAEVDSATRAAYWVDSLGVASICPSRSINKRLGELRAIRKLGVELKLVLDDCCGAGCPAILSHAAFCNAAPAFLKQERCFAREYVRSRPWLIAQKDIVPATLPLYDGLISQAKPDGRTLSLEKVERKLALYQAAESYEHPASIYVEPSNAFDRITTCDRACGECGWCEGSFEWRWEKLLGAEES
jgi:hypothetical protein